MAGLDNFHASKIIKISRGNSKTVGAVNISVFEIFDLSFEMNWNYWDFELAEISERECSRFGLQTQLLHWPADLQANRLTPSSTFCTTPSSFTEQILKITGWPSNNNSNVNALMNTNWWQQKHCNVHWKVFRCMATRILGGILGSQTNVQRPKSKIWHRLPRWPEQGTYSIMPFVDWVLNLASLVVSKILCPGPVRCLCGEMVVAPEWSGRLRD